MIKKVRQFREVNRLRRAAHRNPSPASIGLLAERFISLGRTDDAWRVAEEGMRRFPTSERLNAVRTFAKKERLKSEIQKLRRDLSERPTPAVYSRLAEIYRELGNLDQALGICEQCVERFPLNENPYLIIGEIRLARFFQDLVAFDGLEAERQLRRVVKLNGQNLKAHLLLAQIYFAVGATDAMKTHLDLAITLSPDNRELPKFAKDFELKAEQFAVHSERPRTAAEVEEDDLDDDFDDPVSVEDQVRAVESRGSFRFRPETFPAWRLLDGGAGAVLARLDVEKLKQNIREISDRSGVANAVILDRDGESLADAAETEGLTRRQFAELVMEVQKTAEDVSRRMDVGTFHWCTVEGAFGGISIARVKGISLGVKYGATVRADRAHEVLEEFAARNFTARTEAAGA